VGVEPTILAAKDRINGFEGHEGHRTPFASELERTGLRSTVCHRTLVRARRRCPVRYNRTGRYKTSARVANRIDTAHHQRSRHFLRTE
jgi:hypothetical protein